MYVVVSQLPPSRGEQGLGRRTEPGGAMRIVRSIAPFVMFAAGLVPTSSSADPSAPDAVVQVGAVHPTDPDSVFNYTRFYPDNLQVHRGDLVEWRWGAASYFGWHSVSFIAGDTDVAAYPDGNEDAIPKVARLDEAPGSLAFDEDWIFGTPRDAATGGPTCGRGPYFSLPAQEPCTLSGTGTTVSSSISDTFFNMPAVGGKLSFSSSVDLPVGVYRYRSLYLPGMEGRVEVLPDDQLVATAAELEEERARQIAEDTAEAEALVQALEQRDAFDPAIGEWTVLVGADTASGHVSIYRIFPSTVPAQAGQRVRFIVGSKEPHAVTFTRQPIAGRFGCGPSQCSSQSGTEPGLGTFGFPIGCDLDGPATGAPAVFYLIVLGGPEQWCLTGSLEWSIAPWMADAFHAPGDEVSTPATFHSSGLLFDASLPLWYRGDPRTPGGAFPSEFEARFPNTGEFPFYDITHPDFMFGSVVVS